MKKNICLLLVCIMFITMAMPAYADETENTIDEWYEMVIQNPDPSLENISSEKEDPISPQTVYIMNVQTRIRNMGSGKVGILCDVYCNQSVKSIVTIFSLQKLSNGSWKTVSSGTTSVSNSARLSKSATVSGVSSGTYRAKTVTKVTDNYGHSETLTGYSGSITF